MGFEITDGLTWQKATTVAEDVQAALPGDVIIIRGSRYTVQWVERNKENNFLIAIHAECRGKFWSVSRFGLLDATRVIKAADVKKRKRATYPFQSTNGMPVFQTTLAHSERNDCVVRAIALGFGITYEEAHTLVQQQTGRKQNKGTSFFALKGLTINGRKMNFEMSKTDYRGPRVKGTTIQQLLSRTDLPKRFAVTICGHVALVIDGVWHDTFKPGARSVVRGIYPIEEVSSVNG